MVAVVDQNDQIAKLQQKVELLEKAGLTPRVNQELGTVSYFESEPEPVVGQVKSLVRGRGRDLRRVHELRQAGYSSQFRSFGDQLKSLADSGRAGDGDYADRYSKQVGSLLKSLGLNSYEGEKGASLVFPEFSSAILEREIGQDLWGLADNYTIGGNSMSFPRVRDTNRTDGNRTGGLQSYWKGEEQTLTASTPQFDTTSLKLNKLTVLVYVTEEMLDDTSVALEQFVSRRVRAELTFGLSNAMFRGTGVGQPLGFLSSPALVTVTKETDQTADTINGDNVVKMWSRRLQESESNYVWLINQDCEPQLFNLQLGTSYGTQLVYLPPGGLSGTQYGTLMGRPVISTEFNSTVGDLGDICLVDTKQYLTIGKGGITESVSPHVEFLRDALCYKFTVRVDGRPAFDAPVTPFKGSNTQSGFIALQAR